MAYITNPDSLLPIKLTTFGTSVLPGPYFHLVLAICMNPANIGNERKTISFLMRYLLSSIGVKYLDFLKLFFSHLRREKKNFNYGMKLYRNVEGESDLPIFAGIMKPCNFRDLRIMMRFLVQQSLFPNNECSFNFEIQTDDRYVFLIKIQCENGSIISFSNTLFDVFGYVVQSIMDIETNDITRTIFDGDNLPHEALLNSAETIDEPHCRVYGRSMISISLFYTSSISADILLNELHSLIVCKAKRIIISRIIDDLEGSKV
jgi:hypothetical protein